MIGCTKLLCGTATVSDALKYGRDTSQTPARMLQFSTSMRPLVVWNITNRCNLKCRHCYLSAEDRKYTGELTTEEAKEFITDLSEMKAPVLLFSGGEPLLRRDIFELGRFAVDLNLRVVLSTNGTLITPEVALKIKDAGFQYAGISLDGISKIHDDFRAMDGAFKASINGMRNCMEIGVKTGVRFTINKFNQDELPKIIDLVVKEGIPRFCMYHLVYSGRGFGLMSTDTSLKEKREIIEFLVAKTLELHKKGVEVELLTVDNHADGVYIYNYLKKTDPKRADEVMQLLRMHGGCSAGTKFANVDPLGDVHPCQFWQHDTLGNVKERKFSEIWNDEHNEFLIQLRQKSDLIKGRCGRCSFKSVCGGCRIRAQAASNDLWAEDPACYLTDEEININ
ncbi:TPA: radical SAM protein [Candidatus Poribacteria bacterium]|nr:radical SAM protein [Candidatus Poribacteria bacterium]